MPRSRRRPLVCQYVENLSSAGLERYADLIREIVGRRHGVYALYRREKLYYVGLATNLRSRLKAHLRDKHKGLWDRFSVYLTIDDGHLKELESLVLRITQPKGNTQRGKFAKSENLMRTLRARYRQRQREEWDEFIGRDSDSTHASSRGRPRRARTGRNGGPVLAGYVSKAMTLRGQHKGKILKARVRINGTIRMGSKVFNSPSLAASAAVGHAKNGWGFWKYERAPGQWVKLRELRRR